jgi:hypothetical protein
MSRIIVLITLIITAGMWYHAGLIALVAAPVVALFVLMALAPALVGEMQAELAQSEAKPVERPAAHPMPGEPMPRI